MQNELFLRRFQELQQRAESLPIDESGVVSFVPERAWRGWATSCQNLIKASGASKSLLDAMPRIRNSALHAEWDRITEPDVNSVIGFVEQLLLTKFSPR